MIECQDGRCRLTGAVNLENVVLPTVERVVAAVERVTYKR